MAKRIELTRRGKKYCEKRLFLYTNKIKLIKHWSGHFSLKTTIICTKSSAGV